MNGLKKLYTERDYPIRTQIQFDLKKRGISRQRLAHWLDKEDVDFLEMPVVLQQIICKNIPEAEVLFKLPEIVKPNVVI